MCNYDDMVLVPPEHTALTTACKPVADITPDIREQVVYMIRTMRRGEGVGICANQVGYSNAIFITNVPGDHIRVYINPTLENLWGRSIRAEEGCLSFPGVALDVVRKEHVLVHALNLKGEQMRIDTSIPLYSRKAGLLLSTVLQHEFDHLHGVDMSIQL